MINIRKLILFNYQNILQNIERNLKLDKNISLPNISRSDRITSAIKLYMSKCSEIDKVIENERIEFEFGRRYLAKMMGADPETFTQNDIDESIRYLFPSNLFSEKARPIMTNPLNIYPKKKPMQCDDLGRPFNTFYYTGKPVYHSIMNEAVFILEKLKSLEDLSVRGKKIDVKKIELNTSRWMNIEEFANHCFEKIPNQQFNNWQNLMEKLYQHPYNNDAESFLKSMRVSIREEENVDDMPQIHTDPETGRKYSEAYGQKKWTTSEIKLFMPGTGKITINNESLLDVVPFLSNRECILFPLQFTNTVGKVDIEASSNISGSSSLAYSLRLAISRALSPFMLEDDVVRMRLAGLLTQDDRYKERKRPGQPKARKKATWRHR